ncbi:hypothetical protein H0H87_012085 [Tephrocybe sp. NHM501043]|nr:hypothetical protein H0H87_012085 [Tephrocybe sp. NHM501043]
MRLSAAIFSAVAVLFVGVAHALPRGGGGGGHGSSSNILDTRGNYNGIAARPVYNNLPERSLYYDELSKRELTDLYVRDVEKLSARSLATEGKSRLERRDDTDTCTICWNKIRAPETMTSMCVNSSLHEFCSSCVVRVLMEMEAKCPMCRGHMDGHRIVNRVCKERTPSPPPATKNPPSATKKGN